MKDRKQHVLKMAHQLFIDKGFQATSIQDILDYSGIAKGTFYNYFSSKNELLIALFKTLFDEMKKKRDELLLGKDPSDLEIFIQQVELQLQLNRSNNLSNLFEEVFITNDEELKQLIKEGNLRLLRWVHRRLLDLFGEEKKPYLLDCAIMFVGILNHNYKFYLMSQNSPQTISQVVRYSVQRLIGLIDDVSTKEEQLINPELLEAWLPDGEKGIRPFHQELHHVLLNLRKQLPQDQREKKYIELLDFIYDELVHSNEPRQFVIETTLLHLKDTFDLEKLETLIKDFFNNRRLI